MSAFERHKDETLDLKQKNQYFEEMAMLGNRMGASDLPVSYSGTEADLESYIGLHPLW
jgi:hypothetical protein